MDLRFTVFLILLWGFMVIKYLGHSAFMITTKDGVKIITDPYSPTQGVNYKPVNESADIVTVSHEHWDHNATKEVRGAPVIIKGEGTWNVKGISIRGIPSFHDEESGAARGKNTIFIFTLDGIKICHMGDLGHSLGEEKISEIGPINICLIPVGGCYTIDAKTAKEILKLLNPNVTIPMHFKTPSLEFPISDVKEFLKGEESVTKIDGSDYEITCDTLPPEGSIFTLNPARAS